jgi:ribonuclease P protein component
LTRDGPARLTLPSQRRLRRKSDFDAAYARGQRLGNAFFAVTVCRNDAEAAGKASASQPGKMHTPRPGRYAPNGPRLGLAVAVRTAGNAVERNRIRRVIRESFRVHQRELPAVDLVVSARSRARRASGAELRAALETLWKKVAVI